MDGKIGAVLKVPRPVHLKKNQQASDRFEEEITQTIDQLGLSAKRPVRLWIQDESRLGLQTVWRRMWGIRKLRLVRKKQLSFQNFWVYGAMEMTEGKSEFAYMPYTSKAITQIFLEQISQSEPDAQHIVVWDGAGFHQNDEKPDNIYLIKLPAYSPELSPQEKLWDVLKDRVANTTYKNLEELMERATEGLRPYFESTERILRLVGDKYKWVLKAKSIYPYFIVLIS